MLEGGSAKVEGGENLCEIATRFGVIETTGADMAPCAGVDVVFDFGVSGAEFGRTWQLGAFPTVCVFNVLEHTFDPLTVLLNSLSCVEAGGALLVVTPSIWPIHNFPRDFNRMLPDWYREFARRTGLDLPESLFCWLSQFGIEPIEAGAELPGWNSRGRAMSERRYWTSRLAHSLLNTYGRSHWATHSAIGAAFVRKPAGGLNLAT
jgi:SAM-dependent methyltransferase